MAYDYCHIVKFVTKFFVVFIMFTIIKSLRIFYKWASGLKTKRNYSCSSTCMKVTVIGGAGKIGQPLCLLLKQSALIDELCIYDIAPVAGLAAELNHVDTNCKVVSFTGKDCCPQALQNSRLVVILAAAPDSDTLTMEKMWTQNSQIVQDIVIHVSKHAPKALMAIGTDPVNSLVPLACEIVKKRGTYNPNTIFGITTLDTVRANTFAARILGLEPECVLVPVIGGHTEETIVPVLSSTKPNPEYTTEEIENLTMNIKKAQEHMLKLKPPDTSAMASAFACARFIISLVKAMRGFSDIVECAYVPSKAHPDTKYLATPLLLGPGGVSKNLGVPKLTEYESCLLDNALMHLKNDVKVGEQFAGVVDDIQCDPCDIDIPRCPKNWCDLKKERTSEPKA